MKHFAQAGIEASDYLKMELYTRHLVQTGIEASYYVKMELYTRQLAKAYRRYFLFLCLSIAIGIGAGLFMQLDVTYAVQLGLFALMYLIMIRKDVYTIFQNIKDIGLWKSVNIGTWLTLYLFLAYWNSLSTAFENYAYLLCVPLMLGLTLAGMEYQNVYPALHSIGQTKRKLDETLATLDDEDTWNKIKTKHYVLLRYIDDHEYLDITKIPKELLAWKKMSHPMIKQLILPCLSDLEPKKD